MIFTATRFENGVSLRCEADNIVMRDDLDKPLHDTLLLEVMCKYNFLEGWCFWEDLRTRLIELYMEIVRIFINYSFIM